MGGHPVGGAVDSGGGFRTGFHWAAVDSFRGPAEATPEGGQSLVLLGYVGRAGRHWIPVASQKNAAVAGDVVALRPPAYDLQREGPVQSVAWRAILSFSFIKVVGG